MGFYPLVFNKSLINQFVVWFLRVDYLMLDLEKGLTLKLLKI